LQRVLLYDGAFLAPLVDVLPTDKDWESIQRLCATGILRTKGVAQGWANKTYFQPDSTVGYNELVNGLQELYGKQGVAGYAGKTGAVTAKDALGMVDGINRKELAGENLWVSLDLGVYQPDRPVTRRQMAILLDKVLDPFSKEVSCKGEYVK
jgi:hypothetical protein